MRVRTEQLLRVMESTGVRERMREDVMDMVLPTRRSMAFFQLMDVEVKQDLIKAAVFLSDIV